MKLTKYSAVVLSVAFTFFISACSSLGMNIFSDADEVALGANVANEIAANQQEYPIYRGDPALKQYIKSQIFDQILVANAIKKRSVYQYELEIIDRPDILNAFALPGGKVYVYTGLLKYLDSEAALAGVLGHEIAHAERRHATQRMTNQYGTAMLISLVLGQNPNQYIEIAANLFAGLSLLSNSRSAEDESDKFSIEYLKETRFYPGGVKFFFEKLRDDGKVNPGGSSGLETFLSTHPDPIARISTTDKRLTETGFPVFSYTNYAGQGVFRNEYLQNITNRLPK
ncbi:MAG: M48 family metalloprotease [Ignavibacteriales bacterium]|jgi:predicted Zn-dependent protease|nr:M48 family metalloprotease [Ignavibacteriales bacterium]MBP7542749.1 M48 family metalloprotease [Ignavibacteriaceae bacterium]MCC6638463.1 M48 family metalloprotease [Ignavibacteriaceae bacterium]